MLFCPQCGIEVLAVDDFCGSCGRSLTRQGDVGAVQQMVGGVPQILPYRIPLGRVLLMSVLSYGLYLFYWFYLTWKHYRDHTRTQAFPVWHALTLMVPVYGLFRTHAHVRSFNELLLNANLYSSINAGTAVVSVLVINARGFASFLLSGGLTGDGELTQTTAIYVALLGIISIAIVTVLLLHLQGNLNRYWASLPDMALNDSRIGVGEVILVIIGLLLGWGDTVASIVSEAYRMAQT